MSAHSTSKTASKHGASGPRSSTQVVTPADLAEADSRVRVDSPHGSMEDNAAGEKAVAGQTSTEAVDSVALPTAAGELLDLHGADLAAKLTHWSDSLDAREASLNVRQALQEQQERQDRVRLQHLLGEIDEARKELDQLHQQVARQARRAAFAWGETP